jgi:hypothetical protein
MAHRQKAYYCTECESQVWMESNYDGFMGRCKCSLKSYYFTVANSSDLPFSWRRGDKIESVERFDKI